MIIFRFPDEVNERASRILAASVAMLIATGIATRSTWLLPILAGGFFLRWGFGPRFSPLARFAIYLAPRVAQVRMVAGPPKRFAQAIGAICLTAAFTLVLLTHSTAGWALATLVAVFASLEAALGFCMGCWIYGRLIGLGLVTADRCESCALVRPPN
jgi:hypothetical protein